MKIIKKVLIACVILTIIGVVAFRTRSPSDVPTFLIQEADEGVFRIGVMSPTKDTDEKWKFLAEIALEEINTFCNESGIDRSFEFVYSCADSRAQKAIDLTKEYHENGIDLVLGYGWSSFICSGARGYADENGMILLSPSSTSPLFEMVDNVFRLCPHDGHQYKPIVRTLQSLDVTDVVVLSQGFSWADCILEGFQPAFEIEGGKTHCVVEYPPDYNGTQFREILEKTETELTKIFEVYGSDGVAVLHVGFEAADILTQAENFTKLTIVPWFGTDATAMSDTILRKAGGQASQVHLISPYTAVTETETYERVNARWQAAFHEPLGFYDANIYDGCWVLALSALEVDSDNGTAVREVIHEVAGNYTGASGRCLMNQYGDRMAVDYALWRYFEVDGDYRNLRCGTYDYNSDEIEWDENLNWTLRAQ